MSGSTPPPDHWTEIEVFLQLFFPQFFDPQSPQYVDPDILLQLATIGEEARPWCLSEAEQNLAEAYFVAYLVSLRKETSSGVFRQPTAGPVTSEKEGDIQVNYAFMPPGSGQNFSKRPPSDPWDVWNRFWNRCAGAAIMTRYGDPVHNGFQTTSLLFTRAMNVWYPIW